MRCSVLPPGLRRPELWLGAGQAKAMAREGAPLIPPPARENHGERGALLNDPKITWDFRTAPNWKGPEHPTEGADVAVTARSEIQRPTVA